ncbi:MAG: glycosyltransferase family 2 protein [Paracoccaceae bacterium]
MTRSLAILTVRNEAAFLLEWLAHHKAVGFTDFLIFSNDCDDGTSVMLDRLAALGEIIHVANPAPHPRGPQWEALKLASAHPAFAAADWAMVLDVDEFLNIHTGDGTLGALRAALPEASAITLTWRIFGNNGVVNYTDKPVTELFTKAAPAIMGWPWRAAMFKTYFRADGTYAKLGVHRPRAPDKSRLKAARWFDGAGNALDEAFKTTRLFSALGQDNYKLAQLNHYPLGAMESYLLKVNRGRSNREDGVMGMDYWCERNWASVEDLTIARMAPARDAIWARFAADDRLGDLHAKSVIWRREKFAALMLEDANRALFGRLVITPPARPAPAQLSEYIFKFAHKAQRNSE